MNDSLQEAGITIGQIAFWPENPYISMGYQQDRRAKTDVNARISLKAKACRKVK